MARREAKQRVWRRAVEEDGLWGPWVSEERDLRRGGARSCSLSLRDEAVLCGCATLSVASAPGGRRGVCWGGGGIPLGKPTLGVTRLGFLPSVRLPAELDFFIFLSAEGQAKVLSSLPPEVGTPELVSEGGQGHK